MSVDDDVIVEDAEFRATVVESCDTGCERGFLQRGADMNEFGVSFFVKFADGFGGGGVEVDCDGICLNEIIVDENHALLHQWITARQISIADHRNVDLLTEYGVLDI